MAACNDPGSVKTGTASQVISTHTHTHTHTPYIIKYQRTNRSEQIEQLLHSEIPSTSNQLGSTTPKGTQPHRRAEVSSCCQALLWNVGQRASECWAGGTLGCATETVPPGNLGHCIWACSKALLTVWSTEPREIMPVLVGAQPAPSHAHSLHADGCSCVASLRWEPQMWRPCRRFEVRYQTLGPNSTLWPSARATNPCISPYITSGY